MRFGVAVILISIGCALMLTGVHAAILFGLATILAMPRSELTKPIPRQELWAMLGLLFALIVVLLAGKHFLPSSATDVVQRVASHPAFVVPFWLFMLWGLFRLWQRQKGAVNA